MPLAAGKIAFKISMKQYLTSLHENTDPNKEGTIDEYIDKLADEIETYIKSATLNVPGTGLVAPNGPVTGISITGTLE